MAAGEKVNETTIEESFPHPSTLQEPSPEEPVPLQGTAWPHSSLAKLHAVSLGEEISWNRAGMAGAAGAAPKVKADPAPPPATRALRTPLQISKSTDKRPPHPVPPSSTSSQESGPRGGVDALEAEDDGLGAAHFCIRGSADSAQPVELAKAVSQTL